jgi:hypothetical protein
MGQKDELVNKALDAFEESTGREANDYEYSVISITAQEMVDEKDERN